MNCVSLSAREGIANTTEFINIDIYKYTNLEKKGAFKKK